MTTTTDQTLKSLRANVESEYDAEWGVVYLDNARLPGQSIYEFRAHLSALSKQGLYKVYDGDAFGLVKSEGA